MFINLEMDKYGTIFPDHQVVNVGSKVGMTCHSASRVTWIKDGKVLKYNHRFLLCSIILTKVQVNKNGTYLCNGTYINGTSFTASSELWVGCKKFIDRLSRYIIYPIIDYSFQGSHSEYYVLPLIMEQTTT